MSIYNDYDRWFHKIYDEATKDNNLPMPFEIGICQRVEDGCFRVFPYNNQEFIPFEAAVRRLNPVVAVKTRSSAVIATMAKIELDQVSIEIDRNTHIQILDTINHLSQAEKDKCSAFIRDEHSFIVWSYSLEAIIPLYNDLKEKIIKYTRKVARKSTIEVSNTFTPSLPTPSNMLNKNTSASVETELPNQVPPDTTRPGKETLPPTHEHRTLIVCYDGTANKINNKQTNAFRLVSMLKRDDKSKQIVYYQTGIGTHKAKVFPKITQTWDSMFAGSIGVQVKAGFKFLMKNYAAGDRICIFGFSCGAYTACALVGMIDKVGLLPPGNTQHIDTAYEAFIRTDDIGRKRAHDIKEEFGIDVNIEFVGIWDCVASLGFNLPFTISNTRIKIFRHALSLNERRVRFHPRVWDSLVQDEKPTSKPKSTNRNKGKTDVVEVWFAGCHSDVGGGSVPTEARYSLARISLRWMIRECFRAGTGIFFSVKRLRELGFDPNQLYPSVAPRPEPIPVANNKVGEGKELKWEFGHLTSPQTKEEEEFYDTLSPAHDQLKLAPAWWLLELLPMRHRQHTNSDGQWVRHTMVNLARPRKIAQQNGAVRIHRSVRVRMEAEYKRKIGKSAAKYVPRPDLGANVIWVE